ncbi:MAG: glycoside hydrolase family 3 protein [bacterium]|nr:glycoside hydrolase family 3 protein [bacterium]
MGDMQQTQQERRDARRKRRIRNQIIAYAGVLLFMTAAAAGVVAGAKYLTALRQEKEETQQSNQEALENMLQSEEEIPTPEPESEPEPTQEPEPEQTPAQRLDEIVNAVIDSMTLEEKVAGLFIVTPESITGVSTAVKAGEGTKDALTKYAVGGIVYSAKNIKSREQFQEMLENTESYSKYPSVFLAVREEGGKNAVVAGKGIGTGTDAAGKLGQAGDTDAAYQAGSTVGEYLSDLGINLNFAPVADVLTAENGFLGDRSFGADGTLVGSMAAAMMEGMQSQGVTACVKYFPGMGSTAEDPEKGLSSTDRTEEQFRSVEFPAFQAVIDAGADMIMISNMSAPGLTGDNEPCVFSKKLITDILRGEMGYDGVIITDSLSMAAIADYYGSDQAAIDALKAGCDMLLMPEKFEEAYNGVLQAVYDGVIAEERIDDALRRIYRIKYADRLETEGAGETYGDDLF